MACCENGRPKWQLEWKFRGRMVCETCGVDPRRPGAFLILNVKVSLSLSLSLSLFGAQPEPPCETEREEAKRSNLRFLVTSRQLAFLPFFRKKNSSHPQKTTEPQTSQSQRFQVHFSKRSYIAKRDGSQCTPPKARYDQFSGTHRAVTALSNTTTDASTSHVLS